MKFRIRYDKKKTYGFAYETIEAQGIMHAFKLAKDHQKAIRKITNDQTIIIAQVTQKGEEEK